jgi:hypothetical protein
LSVARLSGGEHGEPTINACVQVDGEAAAAHGSPRRREASKRTTLPARAWRRASSSRASCDTTSNRPTLAAAANALARAASIGSDSSVRGARKVGATEIPARPSSAATSRWGVHAASLPRLPVNSACRSDAATPFDAKTSGGFASSCLVSDAGFSRRSATPGADVASVSNPVAPTESGFFSRVIVGRPQPKGKTAAGTRRASRGALFVRRHFQGVGWWRQAGDGENEGDVFRLPAGSRERPVPVRSAARGTPRRRAAVGAATAPRCPPHGPARTPPSTGPELEPDASARDASPASCASATRSLRDGRRDPRGARRRFLQLHICASLLSGAARVVATVSRTIAPRRRTTASRHNSIVALTVPTSGLDPGLPFSSRAPAPAPGDRAHRAPVQSERERHHNRMDAVATRYLPVSWGGTRGCSYCARN